MPFTNSESIEYFYFENMRTAGLVHGIFARSGGVSPEPWGSLNTGSRVGDKPERVVENLSRAALVLQRSPLSLMSVRQVHGNQVHRVDALSPQETLGRKFGDFDHPEAETLPEADAIITQNPAVTLFMRFADCVPILLYDPVNKAGGIAHAGWRGTVKKVAARIVESLASNYGSKPGDLIAGVGPSICVHHYEVGQIVLNEAAAAFGIDAGRVVEKQGTSEYFNLWEANRIVLEQAGVNQIEISAECTLEQPNTWFSHRGENGKTGRFVAMMALQE